MSDHKFNVTLKAGNGYDAPWLTIGSDDPNEVHAALAQFAGLDPNITTAALITGAAQAIQAPWTAKDKLGATPLSPQQQAAVQHYQAAAAAPAQVGPATQYITGQAQPAQQQPASNVVQFPQQQPQPQQAATPPAPSCRHGQMTFRSGNKNGKPWTAYFCPTPKGTPDQCEPVWNR